MNINHHPDTRMDRRHVLYKLGLIGLLLADIAVLSYTLNSPPDFLQATTTEDTLQRVALFYSTLLGLLYVLLGAALPTPAPIGNEHDEY